MQAQSAVALEYPLRLTGHPLIDVGVDTLAVMVSQERDMGRKILERETVHMDELRPIAQKIKNWYTSNPAVRRYLSVIFSNSSFVQPSHKKEQRESYADEVLFAFLKDRLAEPDEERCTFFPELAANRRAYRQHIPLLNGEEVSNFSGRGQHGLPVSGLALLAIHAMPLGCMKAGNMLLFHQIGNPADERSTRMNYLLARDNYATFETNLSLAGNDKSARLPGYSGRPRTRFIDHVLHVRFDLERRDEVAFNNITGYYWTNYGPKPDLEIIRLDNTVLDFIEDARQRVPDAWDRVVNSGWQRKKGDAEGNLPQAITRERTNWFYERLFELPDHPLRVLVYLARAKSWQLIEIFLRKVMLMEQERINVYRDLGDRLADYALRYTNQPHSFWYSLKRARNYGDLRDLIMNAAMRMMRNKDEKPLFTYEEFILAFEPPREVYSQWKLARDLVAVRMLERLHEADVDLSELPAEELEDE